MVHGKKSYEEGRRTYLALHNYHFYVFVRRSASSGEHSVPVADDGRAGGNGGITTGGGKTEVFGKETPPVILCVPQIPVGPNWDRTRMSEVDTRRLPAHHRSFSLTLRSITFVHVSHIYSRTEFPRQPISLLTKKGVREAGRGGY